MAGDRVARRTAAALLLSVALVSCAARAGCSEAEDREWLAAREQFAGRPDRQADVDSLIRRRIELCTAARTGRMTQQAADQQFEQLRAQVMRRWGGMPGSDRAL